ncbi:MAG: dihydropteroate synthase [bacterium]|nr:dihydropteroate synthase [Candidatus Kapabacteria bacterium]
MLIDELFKEPRRPLIMGIVNVTPDSFSDGGLFLDRDNAVAHALALADDGADIVDIGGESTRPPGKTYGAGSASVSVDEELARVIPVIDRVHRERPSLVISVDTQKSVVASAAIAAGATIVNDVSAGRFDDAMWSVVSTADVMYVLMHGHNPHDRASLELIHYDDVVSDVHHFLAERISGARSAGVRSIVADVGIGFAKGHDDNIRLLREHRRFVDLGVPLLVGASRKAFLGRMLGDNISANERDAASLAVHATAAINGATIIRTHDVRSTLQFFTVFNRIAPI